tara:strand:- start:173 stop:763 length:591 start_codon:yes stop_codon:yes gene_type:complete
MNLIKMDIKYSACITILFFSCTTEPKNCGNGYLNLDGKCYNEGDIYILKSIIDSSYNTISMKWDKNYNGIIEPLELNFQKWNDSGRLTTLWLYDDTLSGNLPINIGDLEFLDTLNLSYNQLTGTIPNSIGELNNLNYLYLYHNELSGNIPESLCNINLDDIKFQIWGNKLCPPYPSCISKMKIGIQDTSECFKEIN